MITQFLNILNHLSTLCSLFLLKVSFHIIIIQHFMTLHKCVYVCVNYLCQNSLTPLHVIIILLIQFSSSSYKWESGKSIYDKQFILFVLFLLILFHWPHFSIRLITETIFFRISVEQETKKLRIFKFLSILILFNLIKNPN